MDGGHIIALDTSAGLIGRLGSQAAIDCRLDGQAMKSDIQELHCVTGVRSAHERYIIYTSSMQTTLESLLSYASSKGITLTDLQMRTPTLEDVFLELTGRELRAE
jgi:ABC-2 type transport system ATP-binding protein